MLLFPVLSSILLKRPMHFQHIIPASGASIAMHQKLVNTREKSESYIDLVAPNEHRTNRTA
ncbi:hypothetical protein BA177_12015 [Woeseia oceani]|uniref:Uncharacterized protein n=1 Tax=Woeseia oceani TaxID=1548547 RepID=A0A193LH46_9GAMM|nr:hypothetical protein BA177_12015 [Woeseia oceani]